MKNLIGQRVRQARDKRYPRMSQQELAARLQIAGTRIDRTSIAKIEARTRTVTDLELVAIAAALGVTPEWLLFGGAAG
ncbi:MAG: helix-turn-helix transcriptional regulator [Dehalococcoidia bacterium]